MAKLKNHSGTNQRTNHLHDERNLSARREGNRINEIYPVIKTVFVVLLIKTKQKNQVNLTIQGKEDLNLGKDFTV